MAKPCPSFRPERLYVTVPLKMAGGRQALLGVVGVVLLSSLHVEKLSLTPGSLQLRLAIPEDTTPDALLVRVQDLLSPWANGTAAAETVAKRGKG